MSFAALQWAGEQRTGKSTDKLVLMALADRHNETCGLAFPSVKWLVEFSSLNRKTVIAALDRLEKAGLITDSGQRKGQTKQVKAYILAIKSPEKGIPKTGPLAGKGTVFTTKESQKRDTEPVKEPKTLDKTRARALPVNWVPAEFGKQSQSRKIVDGWSVDELTERIEAFSAHHRARNNKFPDWQSAWSTWVLNTKKFEKGRGNVHRPANDTITNPYARAAARRETERAGSQF